MLSHRNFNPSYPESSVTATFEAVFTKLEEDEPDAAKLFALLSFFDPEYIAADILTGNADQVNNDNPLYQILKYTLNFERSVSQLRQLSLQRFTRRPDEPKALWIHDLVHELYRERMSEQVQKSCLELALTLLHACYPEEILDMNDTANWKNYEKCLPHIVAGIKHADKLDSHSVKFARLCRDAGWFFYQKGQYDKAVELAEMSIPLLKQHFGGDHDDYISALNLLAAANHTTGNFKMALKWYFEVLAYRQRKYGLCEDTTNTMHNIALCYHEGGEYEESQHRFEEVVSFWSSKFGQDDIHTYMSLLSMSRNIRYMGDLSLAEDNLWKCKEFFEKKCGLTHIFTLVTLSELACAIWRRDHNRLAEAESMHREALKSKVECLGEEHMHTWDSYGDIGYMILKCDPTRSKEGEELLLRVIKSYTETMGINHSQTLEFYGILEDHYTTTDQREKLQILRETIGTPTPPTPLLLPRAAFTSVVTGDTGSTQPDGHKFSSSVISGDTTSDLHNQSTQIMTPSAATFSAGTGDGAVLSLGLFPDVASLPDPPTDATSDMLVAYTDPQTT
jgi:tetratricopeptide (TPR) repeat protein